VQWLVPPPVAAGKHVQTPTSQVWHDATAGYRCSKSDISTRRREDAKGRLGKSCTRRSFDTSRLRACALKNLPANRPSLSSIGETRATGKSVASDDLAACHQHGADQHLARHEQQAHRRYGGLQTLQCLAPEGLPLHDFARGGLPRRSPRLRFRARCNSRLHHVSTTARKEHPMSRLIPAVAVRVAVVSAKKPCAHQQPHPTTFPDGPTHEHHR
jgi:hypothetical protein